VPSADHHRHGRHIATNPICKQCIEINNFPHEYENDQGDAMKTSVIAVHDMLSVLSVSGVEKRIGEVPGVESVTVNYAAGSATVRYDETRLDVADIRSAVRQSGYASGSVPEGSSHEGHTAPVETPATPAPAASKTPFVGLATAAAASAGATHPDKPVPGAAPSTTPKPSPVASDAAPVLEKS